MSKAKAGITNCFMCGKNFINLAHIYENEKCDHCICQACYINIHILSSITCFVQRCFKRIRNYQWSETLYISPARKSTLNGSYLASPSPYSKSETLYISTASTSTLNESYLASPSPYSKSETLYISPASKSTLNGSYLASPSPYSKSLLPRQDTTEFDNLMMGLSLTCISDTTVPFAPQKLQVLSFSEFEVSLAWEPSNVGRTPTKYLLEKETHYSGRWALIEEINDISITNYCVKDLEPETSYRFRIKAVNEMGNSSATYCYVTTLDVPKPTSLQVLDVTSNKIKFRWSITNKDNRSVSFDVQVREIKTGNCVERNDEVYKNEFVIQGLKPDCKYALSVATKINGRSSSFADIKCRTNPKDFQPEDKRSAKKTQMDVLDVKQDSEEKLSTKKSDLEVSETNQDILKTQARQQLDFMISPKDKPIISESRKRTIDSDHLNEQNKKHSDSCSYIRTKVAKSEHTSLAYTIRGLPNIGMTCYANSILQVLAQTPDFIHHLGYLVKEFKLDSLSLTSRLLDVLTDVSLTLVDDNIFLRKYDSVSYDKVRRLVSKVISSDSSFQIGMQNDSHSFLITMFNAIKSEISAEKNTEVLSMFEGTFVSKFKYLPCEHEGDSVIQMFNTLLIPIDDYAGTWHIEDGITTLLNPEIFENNALPCDKCHDVSDETFTVKTMEFKHLPTVLILQMGKFKQQNRCLVKIHKTVHYPYILDCHILQPNKRMQNQKCYRLYGVTLHYGSLAGGHYTAYVKINKTSRDCDDQWYDCSDSFVRKISSEFVLEAEDACLLFYHLSDTN